MAFYDSMAATALRILTAKGQDLTLRTIADTTPTTAYEPTRTPTDVTVKGVLDDGLLTEVDSSTGAIVKADRRRYVIAASGLSAAPNIGDSLVDATIVYEIVSITPLAPAGTAVIYILLCN
jgi:hypothetical protein